MYMFYVSRVIKQEEWSLLYFKALVTTITALIGSAQALFSDPQPGKPGYGPGMEAIPASAVIDYPI